MGMDFTAKYKTSEEAFMDSIKQGEAKAKKQGEKSKQLRELDVQLKQLIAKSTFSQNEGEKKRLGLEAQNIKRRMDMLRGMD